jgi:uncharacterized repeat protein (TIGR03803 family)
MTKFSAHRCSRLKTWIVFATFSTALMSFAVQPAQAQTYSVIHSFAGAPNDGALPNGELIQDAEGNIYGTTDEGGTNSSGTVFKLDPTGVVTLLHSFNSYDGEDPHGGLLRDTEGNLYGTTGTGGGSGGLGLGTVFKLDTSNTLKTLYSFIGNTHGTADGSGLISRLVTINGDFYGVSVSGGEDGCSPGCGTIFKVTTGGRETILYRFTGGADGAYPQGLIRDSVGNLYGVTEFSFFPNGFGTVWKFDTAGVFSVLYSFTGGTDGGVPQGRLVRDDATGTLRGVTAYGGDPTCNCGIVFSVDASGNEKVIHKFFGGGGGSYPFVGLLDVGGTFYGMTGNGGDLTCDPPLGCGVLYQIAKTGQYTVLHRFAGSAGGDGAYTPFGGLMLGGDGSIYGANWWGGTGTGCTGDPLPGCGVIFKYTP